MHLDYTVLSALLVLTAVLLDLDPSTAKDGPLPHARLLSDYRNDDGSAPDGEDDATDDTPALRKALADGPGLVCLGPGSYRFGEVTIPSNVSVVGAGSATVVRSSGPKHIFTQKGVHEWALRDLVLDGAAQEDWHKRKDTGEVGLFISGCWGYEVVGVAFRNFSGIGLQIEHSGAGWINGGNLDRITATGNSVGIRFDTRAEYINATALGCFNNVTGCILHAGNAKITASNFTTNTDGIVIEDKDNGSHGSISNCLINHNERYALLGRKVKNGMAISDCCIFYGTILLEDCIGVNLTNGILGCTVKTDGKGVNRIAGNYVIPEGWQFDFTPSTIVEDNFTENGPWEMNRHRRPDISGALP